MVYHITSQPVPIAEDVCPVCPPGVGDVLKSAWQRFWNDTKAMYQDIVKPKPRIVIPTPSPTNGSNGHVYQAQEETTRMLMP